MAQQVVKKRYENVDTGTIFVPSRRVDQATIDAKVKARQWAPRPDLDEKAEKEMAAREAASKPKPERATKPAPEAA